MGNSPAVTWPFLPFHPESSPGGLSHSGTADGRIVGAADIPRHMWMYRPTQGELAKVGAAGSYPRFPNWRNVAKSIGVDPETSGATEIDIREILSRLPDAPDEERLPSQEWLLEYIQQCLEMAAGGGLMNDDSRPVILDNRVREIWNLMRKLNIFPRPSEPEDLSTVTKCRVALDDAERAVRHYVSNVEREDSEKVQITESPPDLVSPSGRVKAWKLSPNDERWQFTIDGIKEPGSDKGLEAVLALLRNPGGLSMKELNKETGYDSPEGNQARNALVYLRKAYPKWREVVQFPSESGGKGFFIV